jgi:hypothetical protein
MGGYRILFEDPRFAVQEGDLMAVTPTETNGDGVHVCVADAQYLRDHISMNSKYLGRRAVVEDLGIWCLTTKELWIALSKLTDGGLFVFRFGWTGVSGDEWYEICTYKMFALLLTCFAAVHPFKSEFSHTADATFYVVCRNFDRSKAAAVNCLQQLEQSFEFCLTCPSLSEDVIATGFLPQIQVASEMKARIDPMLSYVVRLMEIGQASQKWIKEREAEKAAQADNDYVVVVSPVPSQLSSSKIAQVFGIYGRVMKVDGLSLEGKGDGGEDSQAETADTETQRSMEVTFNKQEFASSAAWDLNGRTLFGKIVAANVKGRPPPNNNKEWSQTGSGSGASQGRGKWHEKHPSGGEASGRARNGGKHDGQHRNGGNTGNAGWGQRQPAQQDDLQTTVFPVLPPPYLIAEHQMAHCLEGDEVMWDDNEATDVFAESFQHGVVFSAEDFRAFDVEPYSTAHIVAPPGFSSPMQYDWCYESSAATSNPSDSVAAPPGFSGDNSSDFEFEPEPPQFDHCSKDSKGAKRRKDVAARQPAPEIDPKVAIELLRLRVDKTHRKRMEQLSQRKDRARAQAAKQASTKVGKGRAKEKDHRVSPATATYPNPESESDLERILRLLLVGLLGLVVCRVVLLLFMSYVPK